jgi:hypothetical protein
MSEPATAPTAPTPTPGSRAATRQTWAQRLERFALSGLTPAQFCTNEGVSLPSFYSWKRRLATAAARDTADDAPGPRLLPVRLTAPNTTVELVLPTGTVVRLLPGCDLAFVRSLIHALGETPC